MTKWYGWAGTILNVDLSKMKVSREELSPEFATKYIGGCGFGGRILYDEVAPGADPLGPENVIIIGQGPLCGTALPAARYDLISKSPLTGIYARASGGGFFAPEMKYAGYDLIVIRGKAARPVYLWIDDEHVEIRDASHLWGKDTWTTQRMIQEELDDPDIQVLKIGPAGENRSYHAAVIANQGRAAARVSIAAVWGAKNLKAVAVRGSGGVSIAKPEQFIALCNDLRQRVKDDPGYPIHTAWGTLGTVCESTIEGRTPSDTVYGKHLTPADPLHHTTFIAHYQKNISCFGCYLHCGQFYHVKSGKYQGAGGEGIEGYPRGLLARIQVKDSAFALHYNNLCDQLGLNVLRPAEVLEWAMPLYEQGILTKEDTDGLELTWGNEEAILEITRKIAYREGFGEILSDFPRRTGEKLGKGIEYNPGHIKGNYHPIGLVKGLDNIAGALSHSVNPRGGDHNTSDGGTDLGGLESNQRRILGDMTGVCKFAVARPTRDKGIHLTDYVQQLSTATGVDFSLDDLNRATERVILLARAFNAREGIRRIDDYPYPFHYQLKYGKEHPLIDYSKFQFSIEDYDKQLDEYYRLRGCDLATGIPTREKLESLGMKDVADDLAGHGILPP